MGPEFFLSPAHEAYQAAYSNLGGTPHPGTLDKWPGAVNYVISSYLTDDVLDETIAKLRYVEQERTQIVKQHYDVILSLANDMSEALTPADLVSTFIRGLRPNLAAHAKQIRIAISEDANLLHRLVQALHLKETENQAVYARHADVMPYSNYPSRGSKDRGRIQSKAARDSKGDSVSLVGQNAEGHDYGSEIQNAPAYEPDEDEDDSDTFPYWDAEESSILSDLREEI